MSKKAQIVLGIIAGCVLVVLDLMIVYGLKSQAPIIEIYRNNEVICYSVSTKQGLACYPLQPFNKTQYARRH